MVGMSAANTTATKHHLCLFLTHKLPLFLLLPLSPHVHSFPHTNISDFPLAFSLFFQYMFKYHLQPEITMSTN